MELKANQFNASALIALKDIPLGQAVRRNTGRTNAARASMLAETTDAAALRQQARAAKLRALHDLPELLEQIEAHLTTRGAHVLWALDAREANRHVLDICREHNLRRAVKAKSMVSEEIGLNAALETHGIEAAETDLGEFIVQITGDHPSHITMPLMHRSKEMIRDDMMARLGMPYTDKPEDMTAFARETLRDKYLQADFGISGGNFLIAETGHLVTVSNEGNIRLSTGVPRVHVAIVGIEKVVPTWEDFATLVQLLTRSGTGQRLTVYVNMFGGPRRPEEPDGPDEFYLILLDNGRSSIYSSEFAEALACIRCGACLNICPVYQNVGGHAYGWVYPGPIGAVITPLLVGKEHASPLPFASSLCGACKQACPVDIDLPTLLLKLRRDLEPVQPPALRAGIKAWALGFRQPLLYWMGGRAASLITRHIGMYQTGERRIKSLPYPFISNWTQNRDFPAFAAQTFHEWWAENRAAKNG